MELPIKWSPEAVEDLEQIVEYIEKDSEYYATAVVSETLNIVQKIEEHYILIVAIIHGKRQIENIENRFG